MKYLLVLALLFAAEAKASEYEPTTFGGVPQDKVLHFSVSALMTSASIKLLQAAAPKHKVTLLNRATSSLVVLGVGYAKESYDFMVFVSGTPEIWQRNQFY